jgi:hypothetical protein
VNVLAKELKMLHKHLHTSHFIIMCCIVLAFIKIYQHNLIIGLNYELQRLEKQRSQLAKERNELFAIISQLHAPEIVMHQAQTKLSMEPIAVDHVVLLDVEPAKIDFIGTTSTPQTLLALHIVDNITSLTGGNHACT